MFRAAAECNIPDGEVFTAPVRDSINGTLSYNTPSAFQGFTYENICLEFKDGKHTGRTIDADIIYMLEDYTGLTEGYCILGIRVTDYTGKVSETDTESGAEHE